MSFTRQVLPKPAGLSGDHANTKDQLALLQRQNASLRSQNNALKRTLNDAGLTYELPSDDRRKRPKFNKVHCDQCSKDKKGCWPRDRVWPQKCTRCIQKGLECSEGRTTCSKALRQLNDGRTTSSKQRQLLVLSIVEETKRLAKTSGVDRLQTTSNDERTLRNRQIDIALELYELCMTFGMILLLMAARCDQTVFIRLLLASGIAVEGGFLERDLERFLDHRWSGKAAAIWLEAHSKDLISLEGKEGAEIYNADFDALKHLITVDAQDEIQHLQAAETRKCLSLMTPLMSAIGGGQFAAAQLLLETGADPDAFAPRSPAQIASTAWLGFAEVLEVLMRDPDVCSRTEPSVAIMTQHATVQSHVSITERMCNATGDVDDDISKTSTDDCDWSGSSHPTTCGYTLCDWHTWQTTPLLHAITVGDGPCVKTLLDAKCSIYKPDGQGNAPLHLAVSQGRLEVLEILLHAGADVFQRSTFGAFYLGTAAMSGQYSSAKWLIDHGARTRLHSGRPSCMSQFFIETALRSAADGGYTDIVDLLLNSPHTGGISIDNSWVLMALRNAVTRGHHDIVRLLVQAGAACIDDAQDLLSLASSKGHVHIVKLLLSMRPTSFDLDQALLTANEEGHTAIVATLLYSGADVKARHEDGLSLLDVASRKGYLAMVHLLIPLVRNPSSDGWAGRALLLATQNDHTLVVKMLLEAGASSTACDVDELTPLAIAAKGSNLDTVNLLLERDTFLDVGLEPALLLAVKYGRDDIAFRLISHGASLHVKDRYSCGLLLIAAKGLDLDTFCMLRRHGLCIDPEDPESTEVLFRAIDCEDDRWVLELLEAGADPYMTWRRGTEEAGEEEEVSILRFATMKSWYPVVKYLLDHNVPCEGLGERSLVRGAIRRRQYATASLLLSRVVAELEAELLNTLQLTRGRRLAIQQEVTAYADWIKGHLSSKAATLPSRSRASLDALLDRFAFPVERLQILLKQSLQPSEIVSFDRTTDQAG